MPNKKIGNVIRSLREKRNLTQKELASRIGLNNSVLSRIESGNRPVNDTEINLFADFFQVTTDYLLGRTEHAKKLDIKCEIRNMELFDLKQWDVLTKEDILEIQQHFEWVKQRAKDRKNNL
ncbi:MULTISPECIES: helix-turn-helix domain-containing protein [Bacillus]|uniref:helix-turn-helix domain-containing protein n=1 Tax=Bacillus TaxID=1386 RepID=UPI0002597CDF|nr:MULTISPECIES: helix-turn-helix transcriptional regulator [Bacillus]AFI29137.1 XRE family transcriptional regulator [Bacillus sp. JS]KFF55964.1 hypothetical protein CM50_07775 [Bacillus subtilis] [Bacillus stercoris]MCY8380367.1 helix-turn-helix domain-containing protein [Bacillus haynesii]MEC0675547.1 helix-turn-helix transcriptional regulator [Bacillus haynesii]MEC1551390.1 helix-turn-helix transcriptional regulator [Bacillus haynesii]